jgi:hypothetical protein
MKINIEITDDLLREISALALREKLTMEELVERGLRLLVAEEIRNRPFTLRDASFKGEGPQPPFRDADWHKLCEMVYEGRGGKPS